MKLVEQILNELGAEDRDAFTVCPGKAAYFCNVKAVEELSEEKVVLLCGRRVITAEGAGLSVGEYFCGDMIIKGDIKRLTVEQAYKN